MSFTINMHLCMGRVMAIALFEKADPCMMEMPAEVPDHATKNCTPHEIRAKSCCEDTSVVVEAQKELSQTSSIALPEHPFVAVLSAVVLFHFSNEPALVSHFTYYSPPPIERDIPVLVQAFLI